VTPRILDKNGRELSVGDRFNTEWWGLGEVTGFSLHTPNLSGVTLLALFGAGPEMKWHAMPTEQPDIYRCFDVELAQPESPQQQEAALSGCPERSSP
jgi:hypothetical protein